MCDIRVSKEQKKIHNKGLKGRVNMITTVKEPYNKRVASGYKKK